MALIVIGYRGGLQVVYNSIKLFTDLCKGEKLDGLARDILFSFSNLELFL